MRLPSFILLVTMGVGTWLACGAGESSRAPDADGAAGAGGANRVAGGGGPMGEGSGGSNIAGEAGGGGASGGAGAGGKGGGAGQGGLGAAGAAAGGGGAGGSGTAGAGLGGGRAGGGGNAGMGGAAGGSGGGGGADGGGSGSCSSAYFSSKASGRTAAEYETWKRAHVKDCSNGSAIVSNGGGVVSEGIGYGMLLSVTHDDRTLFDKLWKFYTDHLDPLGLMNWSMPECDPPGNNNANAATDADLDAAMALVQADARWGGYRTQAVDLIHKIKTSETDSCKGLNVLRPGDKFGGCSDGGRVNPSYFAPGYYRVFSQVDSANGDFWRKLADDSYTLLAQYQSKMGGLVPEWANVDGSTDGDYAYNACRTPWRVAVDYGWFCTPAAKTYLEATASYVDGKGGVAAVPFDKNSAFLGAFALSGMAVSQSKLDGFVDSWLGAELHDEPYFQATLRVLYLDMAGQAFLPGAP